MPFCKRTLSEAELSAINFDAIGIPQNRIPLTEYEWAIDETRALRFVQLVSNSFEMREGYYRYLLLSHGKPAIIIVDAFSAKKIRGHIYQSATIESISAASNLSKKQAQKLSSEAMELISHNGQRLLFSHTKEWLNLLLSFALLPAAGVIIFFGKFNKLLSRQRRK